MGALAWRPCFQALLSTKSLRDLLAKILLTILKGRFWGTISAPICFSVLQNENNHL
jgi:hypothetical protein